MTALEITLIIIGIIFLLGSFMVKDKLSKKDIDKIADMSDEELKVIVDKSLQGAKTKISDEIDEISIEKQEETKRELEKESNNKIMAINEYSDTVLESINKAHNEIMFLYSMLNDKHDELITLTENVERLSKNINQPVQQSIPVDIAKPVPEKKPAVNTQIKVSKPVEPQPVQSFDEMNHNNDILRLHKQGMNNVEIAKELGLGLGEIKLVIDLYEEGR